MALSAGDNSVLTSGAEDEDPELNSGLTDEGWDCDSLVAAEDEEGAP